MDAVNEEEVKKEEDDVDSKGRHSHQFTVKFPHDDVEYSVYCDQSCTVLEAIKSNLNERFTKMNCTDEKIIIQLSDKGRESIIATHFPCSCIENDECLTIHCKTEEVEQTKTQRDRILPRDKYSVFYVSTKGGQNTLTKKLFRSNTVKKFDYLCVYANKGMTVREALERDGRFVDLEDFKLSKDEKSKQHTLCTQRVDGLDQKTFKICRDRKKPSQQKFDMKAVLAEAEQSGVSVGRAMEESGTEEIHKPVSEQFKHLKELMERRFPGDSYQEELELKRKNFGKIQQSFSEVHRIRELLKLGESVCRLRGKGVKGTGFVLFDRFVLTNAHLFKKCVEGNRLGTDVYALFNYDGPEPNVKFDTFIAEKTLIDLDFELDYAILELNPDGQKQNQTAETEEAEVPAGLLSVFGPVPEKGGACVIGHPAEGKLKKLDPTCIIEIEKRGQAVDDHLKRFQPMFIVQEINQQLENKGIDSIMVGGSKADKVVTYKTFMYHGASGSPVFDAQCRVFGLHSSGYSFKLSNNKQHVIQFARPLLSVFESFVRNLMQSGNEGLLERVQEAAKGNLDLEQIIGSVVGPRQSEQLEEAQGETQESESLTEGLKGEPEDPDG